MTSTKRPISKRATGAGTVDEYLSQLDGATKKALARLRSQIRRAAPQATEVISYQIPTYRLNGPLVHFAVQPKHLAFYVVSLEAMKKFEKELEPFDVSGRTVRFSAEKPPPATLVSRIVKERVRENLARV